MILKKCDVENKYPRSKAHIEKYGVSANEFYNFCSTELILEHIESKVIGFIFEEFCAGVKTYERDSNLNLEIKVEFDRSEKSLALIFHFFDIENYISPTEYSTGKISIKYYTYFNISDTCSMLYKEIKNPKTVKSSDGEFLYILDSELELLKYPSLTIPDLQIIYNGLFENKKQSRKRPLLLFRLLKPSKIIKCTGFSGRENSYCSNPDCLNKCNVVKRREEKELIKKEEIIAKIKRSEELEIKKNGEQSLYIMFNPVNNLYKVGKSKHPKKRLSSISSSAGCDVLLMKVFKFRGFLEKNFHKKMNEFRVKGEWFKDNELIQNLLVLDEKEKLTGMVKDTFN